MPPTHLAPSAPALTARFLTFHEREEIAIELALVNGNPCNRAQARTFAEHNLTGDAA